MEENKKLLVGTDLKEVFCPLMNSIIDYKTCFDIHMIVEDGAPAWTGPAKATSVPDFKNICIKCKYHRFD